METVTTKKHGIVHICADRKELADASARQFVEIANNAIAKRGRFTVGLSGGSSPPLLYERLTSPEYKTKVDWTKVQWFISDERCVPVESKESNWGNATRLLFDKLNISQQNLHPITCPEGDPAAAARDYDERVRNFFSAKEGEFPRFDLLQLGMGPDGHTASLFPGSKALNEEQRTVIENFADKFETYRITFSFPAINNAENIMFLLEGPEKSHVLSEVLIEDNDTFPVQHVRPKNGQINWYVDQAAARELKSAAASK